MLNEFFAGFYLSIALVMYNDYTACLMLSMLQKFLNFSETKLLSASDINLCGIQYSANMNFTVAMRFSAHNASILFITGNLL